MQEKPKGVSNQFQPEFLNQAGRHERQSQLNLKCLDVIWYSQKTDCSENGGQDGRQGSENTGPYMSQQETQILISNHVIPKLSAYQKHLKIFKKKKEISKSQFRPIKSGKGALLFLNQGSNSYCCPYFTGREVGIKIKQGKFY